MQPPNKLGDSHYQDCHPARQTSRLAPPAEVMHESSNRDTLRRMHHHAAASLAVALDVDAWGGATRRTGGATATLTQQGWRTVGLGPRDRLESVWQELGRTSRSRPAADRRDEVVLT